MNHRPSALETRFWRSALVPRDVPARREQTLTGLTHRWLRDLPEACRPEDLCRRHPGVANAIARCWADGPLSVQLLDDLAEGPPEGGAFPPGVRQELQLLRELRAGRLPEVEPTWLERCLRLAGLH